MLEKRHVFFIVAVVALNIGVGYSNGQRALLPFNQAKDLAELVPFLAESEVRGCVVSPERKHITIERCYLRSKPDLRRVADHIEKEGWKFSYDDAAVGGAAWCRGKVTVNIRSENEGWTVELDKNPANGCK